MSKWTVEYDNDVGTNDDYFVEFWNVLDESGDKVAQCDSQEMAQKLADYPALLDALEDAIEYLQHHLPEIAIAPHRALIAKHRGSA